MLKTAVPSAGEPDLEATRELKALTKEVGRIVRAMDARNRVRFRKDRPALEQWINARTVLGTPRGSSGVEETPAPGPTPVVEGGTSGAAGDVSPRA